MNINTKKEIMKKITLLLMFGLAMASQAAAQGAAPRVKVLTTPEEPTQKTVLLGRALAGDMIIMFEIEPAKGMWMLMGKPPKWIEHSPSAAEKFHLEVKPIDPKSKTRIPYAEVRFKAVNKDNRKKVEGVLHPMWGGSGLHYAMNSALAGDGSYEAQITVGVPAVARAPQDKDMWRKASTATFHFKFKEGKLVEVSEPEVDG